MRKWPWNPSGSRFQFSRTANTDLYLLLLLICPVTLLRGKVVVEEVDERQGSDWRKAGKRNQYILACWPVMGRKKWFFTSASYGLNKTAENIIQSSLQRTNLVFMTEETFFRWFLTILRNCRSFFFYIFALSKFGRTCAIFYTAIWCTLVTNLNRVCCVEFAGIEFFSWTW